MTSCSYVTVPRVTCQTSPSTGVPESIAETALGVGEVDTTMLPPRLEEPAGVISSVAVN